MNTNAEDPGNRKQRLLQIQNVMNSKVEEKKNKRLK